MLGWSETYGFLLVHATMCKLCQEVAGVHDTLRFQENIKRNE